jgi:hypothetical protein
MAKIDMGNTRQIIQIKMKFVRCVTAGSLSQLSRVPGLSMQKRGEGREGALSFSAKGE